MQGELADCGTTASPLCSSGSEGVSVKVQSSCDPWIRPSICPPQMFPDQAEVRRKCSRLTHNTCFCYRRKKEGRANCRFSASEMDCCIAGWWNTRTKEKEKKKVSHLSEGSSSNHFQDLKVLLVQPHLLHFGGERFGCRQKDERPIRISEGG